MNSRHFRMVFDAEGAPDQWFLDEPRDPNGKTILSETFSDGIRLPPQPLLTIPVYHPGRAMDISFGPQDMLVMTRPVAKAFEQDFGSDLIQRFAAVVQGREESYDIVNVCQTIDCIDETRCFTEKWTETDSRPELAGTYRAVHGMKIDPLKVAGHHLFRVAGWEIALIASDKVHDLVARLGATGAAFLPVT